MMKADAMRELRFRKIERSACDPVEFLPEPGYLRAVKGLCERHGLRRAAERLRRAG